VKVPKWQVGVQCKKEPTDYLSMTERDCLLMFKEDLITGEKRNDICHSAAEEIPDVNVKLN